MSLQRIIAGPERARPERARLTRREAGLTLIELIVAFSIMMIMSVMSVPLVRSQLRRNKERELRKALEDMRKAIDKYKDAADRNQLSPTATTAPKAWDIRSSSKTWFPTA